MKSSSSSSFIWCGMISCKIKCNASKFGTCKRFQTRFFFSVNKNANSVVLVITFRNVVTNSSLEYYRYNRRGKEVAVTQSRSYIVFRKLLLYNFTAYCQFIFIFFGCLIIPSDNAVDNSFILCTILILDKINRFI